MGDYSFFLPFFEGCLMGMGAENVHLITDISPASYTFCVYNYDTTITTSKASYWTDKHIFHWLWLFNVSISLTDKNIRVGFYFRQNRLECKINLWTQKKRFRLSIYLQVRELEPRTAVQDFTNKSHSIAQKEPSIWF